MVYLWVKWLHVLCSTLLFGTGLGIAFFMWRADRRGDPAQIAATARTVVLADACFTAPAVALQLLSGLWLARQLGQPWDQFWVRSALLLFFLVGACWLPVLWLQVRARNLAVQAASSGTPLPASYRRTMRWWYALGWPAFIAVLAIFWLMVFKPV